MSEATEHTNMAIPGIRYSLITRNPKRRNTAENISIMKFGRLDFITSFDEAEEFLPSKVFPVVLPLLDTSTMSDNPTVVR